MNLPLNKKKMKLSDIKPIDFGPGSERGSIEVDEIVYGQEIGRTRKRSKEK